MCTLMEKDVLLDTISGFTAFIAYRTPPYTDTDDLEECSLLMDKVLCSDPEQINKQNVLEKIRSLKNKYEGLPVFPCYLGEVKDPCKECAENKVECKQRERKISALYAD